MGRQFIIFLSLLSLVACKKSTSSSKSSPPASTNLQPVCGAQLAMAQDNNLPPPNVPGGLGLAGTNPIDQLTVSATVNWIDDNGLQNLMVTAQPEGSIPSLEDRVADFPRMQICDNGNPGKCLSRVNGALTIVAKSDSAYIDFPEWAGVVTIPSALSGTLFVKAKACTYVRAANTTGYLVPTGNVLCSSVWTNADPSPVSRSPQSGGQYQLQLVAIKDQIRQAVQDLVAPARAFLDLVGTPLNDAEAGLIGVAKGILRDPYIAGVVFSEGLLDNFANQANLGTGGSAGLALADNSCTSSAALPTPPLNTYRDVASTVTTTTTATSITTSVTTQTINNTATTTTTTTQMAVA